MKVYDDGANGSLLYVHLELFAKIRKAVFNFKIYRPEFPNDQNFQKEFFRTSIDVESFFKGVQGNFVSRVVLENFVSSIDFEPKFPLKQVRRKA